MAVVYIREQGSFLRKKGERIAVTKSSQTIFEFPIINVENIVIVGSVQMSSQVLQMLMNAGIDISYMTLNGKFIGRSQSDNSKNIFLRLAQYDFYHDKEKRFDVAKRIVKNKIANQTAIIKNYRWAGKAYDYLNDIKSLEENLKRVDSQRDVNSLMGIEGISSSIYFNAYGQMFTDDIAFDGRNRRPPRDPVNALLSLTYSFLTNDVSMALEAEAFEMYLGYLHGIRYGRKSLALDIVEEFRQPVADRLVLYLFNKRMISSYDFEEETKDGVFLTQDGFKKFCTAYEKWMNNCDEDKDFHKIIKEQARCLKRAVQNGEEYCPYQWKSGV